MQILLDRERIELSKPKTDQTYYQKKSELTYRDIRGLSWIFEEDW